MIQTQHGPDKQRLLPISTARSTSGGKSMKRAAVPPRVLGTRPVRWSIAITCAMAIALVAFFTTPVARAQDNGTITGTVTDASGALVPNANVSVTNTATNQTRETVSNSAGAYRFANVGIGTYNLTVVAQGFQKYTRSGIVVNVAATVEADATLAVGSQAQTVSVSADALQVQTETSEVSTLISGQQVE